ncbi:MAG TPA: enoyl-CoA hydratase/isomerase family protein [Amycolatopsis sp.]|jgi:enoyl-CoA hydratase|nr:enoyl-CoA hydratase/isomerase family protein [Amycolatopsis sp.]
MSAHVYRDDSVSTIVLDRRPVNAFNAEHLEDLAAAVDEIRTDVQTRCLVIKAEGMFSAGADIDMMAELLDAPDRAERMVAFVARMQAVYAGIEALPIPTIAVIDGAATGGGLELALACDFRIVTTTAKIGLPEVRIGLIPGAGGTQRLTRVVGPAIAKQLILSGDLIDGARAAALGIAHQAVATGDLDAAVRQLSDRLVAVSLHAVEAAKRCIAAAGSPDGFTVELDSVRELITTTETAERLTAFLTRART